MNILVAHGRQINVIPPVRNLIEILLRNGHHVTVVTRDKSGVYLENTDNLKYIVLPEAKEGKLRAIFSYIEKRHKLRKIVREEMESCDVLWTTTDTTVRDLGKMVLNYKHVMQLLELIEDTPLIPGQNIIKTNIKKYAWKARKVVVPEYNRAHIQKTWWGLKELPTVLPNKLTMQDITEIPAEVQEVLDRLKKEERKIILYQGVFLNDRDLSLYAQAIEKINDEYCLYIMGQDMPYRKELCRKYPTVKYIPYIKPPFHLCVTKMAHIGLLPYKAEIVGHYSVLNALYCAPNKLYEYAACGLPMIGSDVPGLAYPFETNGIGYVCKKQTVDAVVEIVRTIESRYDDMVERCYAFYRKTDMDSIVNSILEDI